MLLLDITAKDTCQSITSYPVIYEDDTVQRALIKLQFSLYNSTHKRRFLLVLDRNDQYVGLVTLFDVLALLQSDCDSKTEISGLNYIRGWNLTTYTQTSSNYIKQLLGQVYGGGGSSPEKYCEEIAGLKVKKIARSLKSCSVEGNQSLREVALVMQGKNLSTLPVMEKGQLIGLISSDDIILEVARVMINMSENNPKIAADQLIVPLAHSQ